MADGVVQQVRQHALDQAQVGPHQGQGLGNVGRQFLLTGFGGQLELLHHVLHQFRQGKRFRFQPHQARLQTRQFEEFLRQASHLAALRQRDVQIPAALAGVQRFVFQTQRFQVAMQGRQRRAQVVRNIGDQVAALLVLPRQLAPLVRNASAHLHETAAQYRDFIQALVRGVARPGQGGQRFTVVAFKRADGPRQGAQRPRDQRKCRQARHQPQQGHQGDRPQRGAQHRTARHRHRQRIVRLPLQHNVHIARVRRPHAHRRGAEHLLAILAARVIAHNGQHAARQQTLDRLQVHLAPLDLASRRGIAHDAAVVVQQIDLHGGVHRHQHVEQRAHRVGLPAVGVHQFRAARNMLGQPAGQALHHFLLVARIGGDLQPGRRAAAGQQQQREDGGQALGQGESLHVEAPAAPGPAANL
ncbi:hypothetical protein D3C86_708050 [compost metagenome]